MWDFLGILVTSSARNCYTVVETDFYTVSRVLRRRRGGGGSSNSVGCISSRLIEIFANLVPFPGSREREREGEAWEKDRISSCALAALPRLLQGHAKFAPPLAFGHKFFTGFV